MTGEVVSLAEHRPHVAGPVRCLECGITWIATAPIGATRLECPKCRTQKGVWIESMAPATGSTWQCVCLNDLFVLTDTGAPMCARCGVRAEGWAE